MWEAALHFAFSLGRLAHQGPIVWNWTKLLANMKLRFLSWNMANTLINFVENMWVAFWVAFANAKAIHVFAAKISMYLKYLSWYKLWHAEIFWAIYGKYRLRSVCTFVQFNLGLWFIYSLWIYISSKQQSLPGLNNEWQWLCHILPM